MPIDEVISKLKTDYNLFYLAYRGSIAHNLYVPPEEENGTDDVDLIGFVYGAESDYIGLSEWGSRGTKEIKIDQYDIVLYEARKAVKMLAGANPNILSSLWVIPEHVLYTDSFGEEFRKNRALFLSKEIYNSFSGYAHGQLLKAESFDEQALREYVDATDEAKRRGIHPNHKGVKLNVNAATDMSQYRDDYILRVISSYENKKGCNIGYMGEKRKRLVLEHGYDTKNMAHCIRLMRMCSSALRDGTLEVFRTLDRDYLLSIKNGEWFLDTIKKEANLLFESSKRHRDASNLPEKPDMEKIEALLMMGIRTNILGRYWAR